MARRKDGASMSQAIRDMLIGDPKMKAKDVVTALAEKDIKVSPGLVYMVKGSLKGKRGRPKTVRAGSARPSDNGHIDLVASMRKVKALAAEVGGMKRLIELAELLSV